MSERRACRVLGQPRSTQRYRSCQRPDERSLLKEMRGITKRRPRFGCPRVHRELVADGRQVNHKRVHRIWKEENMQVPRKQHLRRRLPGGGSQNSCVRHRAQWMNHVWSYDFVAERTEDGRQLRLLVVIDEYTRECLAIEVGRSFTSRDVIDVLQYLFAVRGAFRSPLVESGRCRHTVHRQGESLGERLRGVVQWEASRRVAQSRTVPESGGGPLGDRLLAS